ncbi:calcium ion binding protein [Aureococcus anophagefferens]|nr:calcium ion binding protein [Aureococcus anophagefferens]
MGSPTRSGPSPAAARRPSTTPTSTASPSRAGRPGPRPRRDVRRGLSYFQRDFWYEIGGNSSAAGINLAPDWLGEDYYCDSPMRGPPATCAFGSPWEPDGCRSFDECGARMQAAGPTASDAAPDAAAAAASGACSHIAPDDVLDACPGTLSKYLASGRYVCAPDPSPAADAEPSSAFVAGPRNTFVAGFRGRIGAVALGSMDAFLSASWHPSDFSAFECAEASYCPQAPFDFAGALYPNDALDGAPGAASTAATSTA